MNPGVALTYGFLLLAVISLWLNIKQAGRIKLWMVFLATALIAGTLFSYTDYVAVMYAIVFGTVVYFYFKSNNILLYIVSLALCIPLLLHMPFAGFHNFKFLSQVKITESALPYNLYFNFDKTLIGIFIIGFGCNTTKTDFVFLIKKAFLYLLLMIIPLLTIALLLGYTRFEPKLPGFTLPWILVNLFFVCTAEEALFRKLIQEKINSLVQFKNSHLVGIFISALLFGLAHFKGGIAFVILAFTAGLFYAFIFHRTRRIESSILLHFMFNLVHFIFFTYPALAN